MNIKKKIHDDALSKINEALGEPQEQVITPKRSVWPKVLIPVGAAALVVGAVAGGIALGKMSLTPASEFARTHPYLVAKRESLPQTEQVISPTSAEIYDEFVKNTALKVLQGTTESMSYSPVDAFVNFATLAYFSSDYISSSLLAMFGNPTKEDLAEAVYEITYAVGTPTKYEQRYYGQDKPISKENGGYSANSLWTGNCPLKGDEEGKRNIETLMKKFLTSIIEETPTEEGIVKWLKACLPDGYEIPKLSVPDGTDAAMVSSYFLKIDNDNAEYDYKDYKSGNHHMPYTFNGKTIQSDYLSETSWQGTSYFDSDNLIGGGYLGVSFFLPKAEEANPNSILQEVVEQTYETKRAAFYSIKVPYFTIDDQHIDLLEKVYNPYCDAYLGIMQKLFLFEMELVKLEQHSKVNLDYDGFTSSSVTIASLVETSAGMGDNISIEVNRPFVFRSNKAVKQSDGEYAILPTCIGVVFDPAYQAK